VNDSRAWRHALAILAGTTLLRLAIGSLVPLFPDETYYWDWSRTLKPGYFDHPPMIAVLIRAGTALFGNHAIGVRLFPILAGSAATLGIAMTARELAGDVAARLATLVFACLPIATVGLVLATPDSPMLGAVAWAMYFVVRALNAPAEAGGRRQLTSWLAAGLAIGLAMSSKYTSVLFPAAVALAFIGHPRLQNMFGTAGPYLAVVVASLVLAPVLWWNGTHEWVSFRFQLGHGLGLPKGGFLGGLNREAQLAGGQIALVSPILFYLLVRAVKRAFEPTPDGIRLTLAFVPMCFAAFFIYSASRRAVEANWPAIAYLPAVVLLAIAPAESPDGARWLNRGLVLGAVLSLVIFVHALVPILPIPARQDQVAKAFGWELLADKVDRRRLFVTSRQAFGRVDLFVAAERYQDASELAFHLGDHPRVFSLNLTGRPNQYDLWGTFPERAAPNASLILVLDDEPGEPRAIRKLTCCFRRIDQGESVALVRGENVAARKRLWFLQGWTGEWPRRDQPFPWVD
jgi:4-amino-4-deoxy-L-arabinose transferase-like glycosyltransferase